MRHTSGTARTLADRRAAYFHAAAATRARCRWPMLVRSISGVVATFLPQSPAFFCLGSQSHFGSPATTTGRLLQSVCHDAASCAVRGVPQKYRGETGLLVFQTLHRYTLYAALVLLVCLCGRISRFSATASLVSASAPS